MRATVTGAGSPGFATGMAGMLGLAHVEPATAEALAKAVLPQYLPNALVVFEMVCHAAIEGRRCPTAVDLCNGGVGNSPFIMGKLAEAGFLRIEVGPVNFRQVFICKGENRGKHTEIRFSADRAYYVRGPERP